MIERPKYLEYRHQRDRITAFEVKRDVEVKVERPTGAFLRLVGKKTSQQSESFQEEWTVELRTTDVMPDRGALVKTQVTQARRTAKGEAMPYGDRESPTAEFLTEVVSLHGALSAHQGSLPTPHLLVFPEEPVKAHQPWQITRHEMLPLAGADGQIKAYAPQAIDYSCQVESFGEENNVEYADVVVNGTGTFGGENSAQQAYTVSGKVRFAIRDGHTLRASIARCLAITVGGAVLTRTAKEKFSFLSRGTEQTVGGMRI